MGKSKNHTRRLPNSVAVGVASTPPPKKLSECPGWLRQYTHTGDLRGTRVEVLGAKETKDPATACSCRENGCVAGG